VTRVERASRPGFATIQTGVGDDLSTYQATSVSSETGCVVTLVSHSKWCASAEPQCEDLDLKLYLSPFRAEAEVAGTFRKCWCNSTGPEGTLVEVKGIATRN
jgi:hypothetical protein